MESIKKNFKKLNIKIIKTDKDGNCMFNAIIIALKKHNIEIKDSAKLRQIAINFIQENKDLYRPKHIGVINKYNDSPIDSVSFCGKLPKYKYLKKYQIIGNEIKTPSWYKLIQIMKLDKIWGNHLILDSLSKKYNLKIHIINNDIDDIQIINSNGRKKIYLILNYNHYDCAVKLN